MVQFKTKGTEFMSDRRNIVWPFYATLILSLVMSGMLFLPWMYFGAASDRPMLLSNSVTAHPKLSVWAWERDEDLSYIDPATVKVSYFAGTIYLRGASVSFRPRTQKLKVPPGTQTIPVFRIESLRAGGAEGAVPPGPPQSVAARFVAQTVATRLKELASTDNVQIDYDALEDERPFYRNLLRELRRQLPNKTRISITALASWLLCDRWLRDGDADEVIAMIFNIGPDRKKVLQTVKKQPLDSGTKAVVSIGISANESDTNETIFNAKLQRQTDTLYVFSSRPWTKERFLAIKKEAFND